MSCCIVLLTLTGVGENTRKPFGNKGSSNSSVVTAFFAQIETFQTNMGSSVSLSSVVVPEPGIFPQMQKLLPDVEMAMEFLIHFLMI